ncbi:LysM peptidoglycan-binding domain-containing protein [uncultured Metabacillus sp.]|uniref:cell division suppressor protein YneA n=1 Tax=Metabacillus sp. Hm71 TaxID=3450743 RepID=UPI0026065137|nr:LysM peptidoglycan-binding domain-containing protein [uncultured Metabacillus sp.]
MKKETIFYILAFFVVFIAVTGALSFSGSNNRLDNFHQVKIEEGDSLWSLAEQFHENANISKQEFVEWVQEKNDIYSSTIKPGDLVVVPVEKEEYYQIEQIASE